MIGTTPLKKAKVELWHCSAKGEYDNSSMNSGTEPQPSAMKKENISSILFYQFPYGIGDGVSRPAHYHLMITAEGYQPLVTQLYFTGDPFLKKDPSSASPAAKRRILSVETLNDKSKKVYFRRQSFQKTRRRNFGH
jgi:protocatechuate 3,4-dioxygenase beta subunit